MDAEGALQTRIGAMLRNGFAADSVRALLGLTGVSEVWPEEDVPWRPAWNLWQEKVAGAYRLELAASAIEDAGDGPIAVGWLSLRYYPHAEEAAALGFSAEERQLVASDRFDETRTPRRGTGSVIAAEQFAIGVIELRIAPAREASALSYSSLDQLRVLGSAPDQGPLRSVPGWRLGRPLFDALVGLEAHLFRRPPLRAVTSCRPGYVQVIAADGALGTLAAPGLRELTQQVAFAPIEDRGWADAVFREITAPPWTVLADSDTIHTHGAHCRDHDHGHGHDHGHKPHHDHHHSPDLYAPSPLWWRLASEDHPALQLPCGCC